MKHKSAGTPGRLMLALMCIFVACAAAFALFVEYMLGWFLFFTHGSAVGWPFGVSFRIALSFELTAYTLLMLTTAAAGAAAIVGFICTVLGVRWEYVGQDYRAWLWFAVGFLCLSAGIFWYYYLCVGPDIPGC